MFSDLLVHVPVLEGLLVGNHWFVVALATCNFTLIEEVELRVVAGHELSFWGGLDEIAVGLLEHR